MLSHEHAFWDRFPAAVLAGVDEAGRGPLAGPVVAGAVVIEPRDIDALLGGELNGLTDSKALTAGRRLEFHNMMAVNRSIRVGVGEASVAEIDRYNILVATGMAMTRALESLGTPAARHALVDGLPMRGLPCASTAIVKGDRKSLLIAAASVVAKVTRDGIMAALHREFPVYGWDSNKGYGTKAHLEALRSYGATPHHRRSFRPMADISQPSLIPAGA